MVKKHLTELETMQAYEAFVQTEAFERPNVSRIISTNGVVYAKSQPTPPAHDYSQDYLTFEVLDNGSISVLVEDVYLSNDNGEHWATEINGLTIGDKVIAKGDCHSFGGTSESTFSFGNMRFNAYGNIMSIYDSESFRTRTTFDNDYSSMSFLFLFAPIVSAEHLILPATTLANAYGCYLCMFQGCTGLTSAPSLPATTLAVNCYYGMFQNCSSLTTAPALPATTLAETCYFGMFSGCTNLNHIECYATDISASSCTTNWVNGVAENGTFIKNPNMSSWTAGNDGIPSGWTVQDAS